MKICENCNQEHDGSYGSGRFCCNKCARCFSTKEKREEINKKVSKTISAQRPRTEYIKICPICKKEFKVYKTKKLQKFCSKECMSQNFRNEFPKKEIFQETGKKSAKLQNKRSKNEIYFAELCQQKFNKVLCNEPIFNGWDADVIIEDYKIAVLWNGQWHYIPNLSSNHHLEQVQARDKIKIDQIKKCGYIPYIIKDMGKKNEKFVKEQFDLFLNYINNLEV